MAAFGAKRTFRQPESNVRFGEKQTFQTRAENGLGSSPPERTPLPAGDIGTELKLRPGVSAFPKFLCP